MVEAYGIACDQFCNGCGKGIRWLRELNVGSGSFHKPTKNSSGLQSNNCIVINLL